MRYLLIILFLPFISHANEPEVSITFGNNKITLTPSGKKSQEWIFESSKNLIDWQHAVDLNPVLSGGNSTSKKFTLITTAFFRAQETQGFYDPRCLRVIDLNFEDTQWANQLTESYASGEEIIGSLKYRNEIIEGVGVRYKGNTSYTRSGEKKSINISIDVTDDSADIDGYNTLNLNNAFGDHTILREALYFNTMKKYVASPWAGIAQVNINGENRGIYSNVQQQDGSLIREYFKENNGDRWKAPSGNGSGNGANGGGGRPPGGGGRPPGGGGGRPPGGGGGRPPGGGGAPGGGFASGDKALLYLGENQSTYESLYELKKENSENAWSNLIHATDVLNNTPENQFKDKISEVLAIDNWLWFLALENIFTDDDSYWNKGCDYLIYFEPKSGRLFPIEHDGNEAFRPNQTLLDPFVHQNNANRPVISKLLNVPEFRQRYLSHMRTILREDFNPETMNGRIDHYVEIIQESIEKDPIKDFTMSEFRSAIAELKNLIKSRYDFLISHEEISELGPKIVSVSIPSKAVSFNETTINATILPNNNSGVQAVYLYHTPQGRIDPYFMTEMFDDGNHGDQEANDGIYGASIPGYPSGEKVWYYVEARSANRSNTANFHPSMCESNPLSFRVSSVNSENQSPVIINEFMASNTNTHEDSQGDYDDWIELHNRTENKIDLSGWYLSDNEDNPRKWQFPNGSSINPGAYLVIWADEDEEDSSLEELHTNFKLSSDGEPLSLISSDAEGNLIMDMINFGKQEENISYGRISVEGNDFQKMTPSPGFINQ